MRKFIFIVISLTMLFSLGYFATAQTANNLVELNKMRATVALKRKPDGSFCQLDVRGNSKLTPSFVKSAHRKASTPKSDTPVCSKSDIKAFQKGAKKLNLKGAKGQKTSVGALLGTLAKSAGVGCVFGAGISWVADMWKGNSNEKKTEAQAPCVDCANQKNKTEKEIEDLKTTTAIAAGVLSGTGQAIRDVPKNVSSVGSSVGSSDLKMLDDLKGYKKELYETRKHIDGLKYKRNFWTQVADIYSKLGENPSAEAKQKALKKFIVGGVTNLDKARAKLANIDDQISRGNYKVADLSRKVDLIRAEAGNLTPLGREKIKGYAKVLHKTRIRIDGLKYTRNFWTQVADIYSKLGENPSAEAKQKALKGFMVENVTNLDKARAKLANIDAQISRENYKVADLSRKVDLIRAEEGNLTSLGREKIKGYAKVLHKKRIRIDGLKYTRNFWTQVADIYSKLGENPSAEAKQKALKGFIVENVTDLNKAKAKIASLTTEISREKSSISELNRKIDLIEKANQVKKAEKSTHKNKIAYNWNILLSGIVGGVAGVIVCEDGTTYLLSKEKIEDI